MPWARFDDRFPSNRKIRLLSDGAFRLYVSAICWSAENLTDGVIKAAELRLVADVRATRTRAEELVDAGLLEVVEGVGWKIHDYHEYNPTVEQAKADRAAKTARQKRWRERKAHRQPDPTPPDNRPDVDASQDASRDGARDADPTRPDPTRTPDMADVGGEGAGCGPAGEQPAPIDTDGFTLTDTMRRWALQTFGPHLDLDHATAQFVSHYRSTGARRKSWPDAWQKWIREDAKKAAGRGYRAPPPSNVIALPSSQHLTGTDASVAGWAALATPPPPEDPA